MATYNNKNKAYKATNPFAIQTDILPDATDNGIPLPFFSGQQQVMRVGDSFVIQTQTGAFRRMKINAERSMNGYIVLAPQ